MGRDVGRAAVAATIAYLSSKNTRFPTPLGVQLLHHCHVLRPDNEFLLPCWPLTRELLGLRRLVVDNTMTSFWTTHPHENKPFASALLRLQSLSSFFNTIQSLRKRLHAETDSCVWRKGPLLTWKEGKNPIRSCLYSGFPKRKRPETS